MSEFINEEMLDEVVGGAKKPTKDPGAGYQWYQIKKGDTLIKIAQRFGTDYKTLAKLNNIPDPSKIYAGNWIKVPKK